MSRVRSFLLTALVLCLVPAVGAAGDHPWFSPENLPPQLQHPLKLLATTAMSGEGKDFFSLKPGQTATIGTITGPAIIFRIWSTSSNTKLSALDMIVDGKQETLVAKGVLPAGVAKDDPLRVLDKQAYWSYLPVVVKKQAVFKARSFEQGVTEPMKFYLQLGYRQVPATELAGAQALDVDALRSWAERTSHPADAGSAAAGQITGEVSQGQPWQPGFAGPAVVSDLMLQALATDGAQPTPEQYRATRLVITCDGVKTVDAPLGTLIGVGHKLSTFATVGTAVVGTTMLHLRFPMPVGQSMTIGLARFGGQPLERLMAAVTVQPLKTAPKYRLCAQYFSQVSVADQPMTLLNVTGEGIFMGTNLSVNGLDRKTFAFLEGNEQIYIDGDTKPTVEGTGAEDYFNNAWYFEAGERTYLFSGVTFKQDREPPMVDCYRYLVSDCIPFQQSLRFDLQHGSRNKAPDVLYEGVNFWYQASPANVAEPVAAKLPKSGGAGPEAAGGGSPLVRLAGFMLALALVVFVAWGLLLKRKS
jgi:hypothetical protein